MVNHQAAFICASTAQLPVCGPQSDSGPCRVGGHCFFTRWQNKEDLVATDELRFRSRLPAIARRTDGNTCLATHPRSATGRTASSWRNRIASAGGQVIDSRCDGRKKTCPNSMDRRKLRSRRPLIKAHGIAPLDALVDATPRLFSHSWRSRPPQIELRFLANTYHTCARKNWLDYMEVGSAKRVGRPSVLMHGFTRFNA